MKIRNSVYALWCILFVVLTLFSSCDSEQNFIIADEEILPTDAFPAWSPDGKWIAYYHEQYESDTPYPTGLYVIDTSGNNRRLLVPGYADSPDWSPDGGWIAFRPGAIYTINFQGDSIRQITPFSAHFPSWSPDGTRIACGRSGPQDTVGIWIVDVQTQIATRFDYGGAPDWSPDGQRFVHGTAPDRYRSAQIFSVAILNKSDRVMLTNNGRSNRYPQWSPHGGLIVWTTLLGLKYEVWIMNADGSNQHKLTDGQYGSFSPDSRMLVVSKLNPAKTKYVLWIINIDGSNLRQITQ